MKDLNAIFCVLGWIPSRITLRFPWEGDFEAARDENYFRPVAFLFQKRNNEEKIG